MLIIQFITSISGDPILLGVRRPDPDFDQVNMDKTNKIDTSISFNNRKPTKQETTNKILLLLENFLRKSEP